MIDHLGFRVRNLTAARRFYEACAKSLNLAVIDNTADSFLVGRSAETPVPFLWVGTALPAFWTSDHDTSRSPIHVAFSANSKDAVDKFHRAALAAGGRDNGRPGPRGPEEMKYYGAYVLDPDGIISRPDSAADVLRRTARSLRSCVIPATLATRCRISGELTNGRILHA